jgi:hypothetical protein
MKEQFTARRSESNDDQMHTQRNRGEENRDVVSGVPLEDASIWKEIEPLERKVSITTKHNDYG